MSLPNAAEKKAEYLVSICLWTWNDIESVLHAGDSGPPTFSVMIGDARDEMKDGKI